MANELIKNSGSYHGGGTVVFNGKRKKVMDWEIKCETIEGLTRETRSWMAIVRVKIRKNSYWFTMGNVCDPVKLKFFADLGGRPIHLYGNVIFEAQEETWERFPKKENTITYTFVGVGALHIEEAA